MDLVRLVVAATLALAGSYPVAAAVRPAALSCEYQAQPLALDAARPRLSWMLESSQRAQRQTAYQVLVASRRELLQAGKADLWDSGKVHSDQSTLVAYAGQPLRSRMDCFWMVRVWDKAGEPSAWSEPAHWSMALLSPQDWSAQWISAPTPAQLPAPAWQHWLWHPSATAENTSAYFRRELELENQHASLLVQLAVDDRYTLYLNGQRVGDGSGWERVHQHVLGPQNGLVPGRNVIGVAARNQRGVGGVLCDLRVYRDGGPESTLLPETGWRVSLRAAEGWNRPDFDAQGWEEPAVVGAYGGPPWGRITEAAQRPRPSICLRREFTLGQRPVRARVYVSGLGMYELRINGKRVGSDVFTPGWTVYPKRIQYQVYDVTQLLTPGRNALAAVLGNGWWSSGLAGSAYFYFSRPGEDLRLLAQLEVETPDGKRETISSDGSWRWHSSPILENTLYHGESYDARMEMPGWDAPSFAGKDWKPVRELGPADARLCAQRGPTLRETGELAAQAITEPSPGIYIYDFGQNHAGYCRLTCQAPAGTRIQIRHSETLNADGTLYTDNYGRARTTDVYICKGGGGEVWQPRFSYRGFRYAELTGFPGMPDKGTLVSVVMHTAVPEVGHFECSNPLLNRIAQNVLWGLRSNLHSVPTDCPQRDERLGWMGDAQAIAPTACWNMHMALFFTKWMREVRDSQMENGATTSVCPAIRPDVPGAPGWGDAVAIIPWVVYQYYGDTGILAENYQAIKRWVEYMRGQSKGDLYERKGYGDWVPVVVSPSEPIGSAYYYRSTWILAQCAQVLGKTEDARTYSDLAARIAAAYNERHFHATTHQYDTGTQTMNLLPLAFGITRPEQRQAVAANIAADVKAHGYHHTTGFLGTPVVLPMLSEYGYHDYASRIISSTEYPSLGYMVEHGATTVWERWNSDQAGPSMNSRNHYAFGAQSQWLWECLGGIRPDPEARGFRHILVHPRPVGDVAWCRVQYETMFGLMASHWEIRDGTFRLGLTIPVNASATLWLPTHSADMVRENDRRVEHETEGVKLLRQEPDSVVYEVGSGEYEFSAPFAPAPSRP